MHNEIQAAQQQLKQTLSELLTTLQNNKSKISIDILKTTYRGGYNALCNKIKKTASEYARISTLYELRIDAAYKEEAVSIINHTIESSGILKLLAAAVFKHYDVDEFDTQTRQLRDLMIKNLDVLYCRHTALLITPECLVRQDSYPLIYSLVNHCILKDNSWIPYEEFKNVKPDVTMSDCKCN